jgi:hypothetical protein
LCERCEESVTGTSSVEVEEEISTLLLLLLLLLLVVVVVVVVVGEEDERRVVVVGEVDGEEGATTFRLVSTFCEGSGGSGRGESTDEGVGGEVADVEEEGTEFAFVIRHAVVEIC